MSGSAPSPAEALAALPRLPKAAPPHGLVLADLSHLPRLGLAGPAAGRHLAAAGLALPEAPLAARRQADGTVLCRLAGPEHLLLAPPGGAAPFAVAEGPGCWRTLHEEAFADLLVAGGRARRFLSHLTALDLRDRSFPDLALALTTALGLNALILRWDIGGTPAFRLLLDAALAFAFAEEASRLLTVLGGGWADAALLHSAFGN